MSENLNNKKLMVNIAGINFKNPIITASGTFGFGKEYNEFYDISKLGGISCKGLTLEERQGNNPVRVAETPAGMLNSVGLQNPGADNFIKKDLVWLKKQDIVVIANIAGSSIEDYMNLAEKLSDSSVDMLEINISCPNVKQGGVQFGTNSKLVYETTQKVKLKSKLPIMVKLSPNVTDISEMALAAEQGGADAISLINTLIGMRIDIKTKRPILNNNIGGLSGPAIFPVALRMVWQVANKVKIPVVGMGGINKWQDAVEMMMAGANAVQVGTANFTDPYICPKIIDGLNNFVKENNLNSINDIVGTVKPW